MFKKIATVSAILVVVFSMTSTDIFAAYKNYDAFTFTIQGKNNQRDNGRFRDDYDNSTPWSVYVSSSTECSTCLTRFWLEQYNGRNVSSAVNVAQGNRSTQRPYDSASRKNNYLTAEDNDIAGSTYVVSGYWDEEWDN